MRSGRGAGEGKWLRREGCAAGSAGAARGRRRRRLGAAAARSEGRGGGSAQPGRRAPGGGGEGGARGGEGELEAGTAETPPGGRRSRGSSGRAAAVAAGRPVAAPSALGPPGLSLPEPGQDCAAGLGAASAGVVRTSLPGRQCRLVRLPRGADGGDGVHLRPASRRRPQSLPPVPKTKYSALLVR